MLRPVDRFFHPVLAADRLRDRPIKTSIGGDDFVLFRPRPRAVACLPDRCPHRHAPLSAGRVKPDGSIECPYHGWSFAADGSGTCPAQPKREVAVAPMQVREHLGYLWVGGPEAAPPDPLAYPGFSFAGAYAVDFAAPLEVVLDLFSEAEHFAWVHHRLGWDRDETPRVRHSMEVGARGLELSYRGRQRDSWLRPLMLLTRGDEFENHLSITFEPVRIVYDSFWHVGATEARRPVHSRLVTYLVPTGAKTCTLHFFHFVQVTGRLALVTPAIQRALIMLSRREFAEDAAFAAVIAHTAEHDDMKLGRFDKALVHGRRLLRSLYHGAPGRAPALAARADPDAAPPVSPRTA